MHAFWEKVDFFVYIFSESGIFLAKHVQNGGLFWTLWDHGWLAPLAPPWLWACLGQGGGRAEN